MKKEDFLRFKDSGGALLIVDRAVAAEFGYKEGQDEVPGHIMEDLRNRQKEVNDARKNKWERRKARPASRLIGRSSMQRPDNDQEVRGEDDLLPTSGPEARGDDLEGGQSVLPIPTDEGRREGGGAPVPGILSVWGLGRDGDCQGDIGYEAFAITLSEPVPDNFALALTGEQ